jgi:hypothetical protein
MLKVTNALEARKILVPFHSQLLSTHTISHAVCKLETILNPFIKASFISYRKVSLNTSINILHGWDGTSAKLIINQTVPHEDN